MVSHYAASKLKRDPLVKSLPELCPGDGPLLHAGCGYGLMTSRLATYYPLRPIRGLDYDPRKVRVANAALGESTATRFAVGDLFKDDLGAPSTILLVDLLHYWPPSDQETLVQRLAAVLPPGGRLVFRDGVKDEAGQNAVHFFERVAAILRFTRVPGPMHFRTEADYRQLLESCDLEIESAHPELGRGSNLVLVCRKRSSDSDSVSAIVPA
jgi:SAM-dependent methyltransferase